MINILYLTEFYDQTSIVNGTILLQKYGCNFDPLSES